MPTPSLLMIPSAFKSGVLASVLPSDGAGDFTVSRPSIATRVNADGIIETMAADVPRLDYSDGGCPVLLTEPQSTNLITRSEDFSYANYNNASVELEADVSPDGNITADKVTLNGSYSAVRKNYTYIAGVTYTISFYAKRVSGTDTLFMIDNTNSVTITSFNLTNEWARYSGTFTPGSDTSLVYWLRTTSVSSPNVFLIWGAQLEEQSSPTSYIKTEATAVTRLADVVTVAPPAGVTEIIETIDGVEQAPITTIPATYSVPVGNINSIEMN